MSGLTFTIPFILALIVLATVAYLNVERDPDA